MKLSQIKLAGFKSFVDNTTINLTGQLVGIVGPNGCGKSNVIDAVRWVLGESSARQLRGDSMQDVIFNGSVSRRQVSRASVELVFINNQQILSDIWNSYAEISIKRILSRNGESLYFINNQNVRRRDITELFLGTGVGSRGYAVIEQGMISRIIEAKPEELRVYLEEAAGVSKYREKRKETVGRLEYTRENLVRLNDICTELAQNIEKLVDQAETAKQYQALNSELKQLQLTQLLLKIDKATSALNIVNSAITNHEQFLATNSVDQQLVQDKLTFEYNAKNKYTPLLAGMTEEFNRLRFTQAKFEERYKNNQERRDKLTQEYTSITQQVYNIQIQIKEIIQVKDDTASAIVIKTEQVIQQQLFRDEQSVKYKYLEQLYLESNSEVTQVLNKVSQAKHELNLFNNTLNHKKQQLNSLNTRRQKLNQETTPNILDLDQAHSALTDEINELNLSHEILLDEIEVSKHNKHDLELNQAQSLANLNQLKNHKSAIEAKLHTFTKLLAAQHVASDLSGIIDITDDKTMLWQGIEVQPGYEVAVEVALGHLLTALPLDGLNQILNQPQQCMAFWHTSGNSAQQVETLSAKVRVKDDDFKTVYNILNQYIVAKDMKEACDFGATTNSWIITQDGHLFTNEYIVFNVNVGKTHVLEYQNQINELELELSQLELDLITAENCYKQIMAELSSLNQILTNKQHQQQLQVKNLHQLNLDLMRQEQNHLHILQHQEKVTLEITTIAQEIEFVEDEIAEVIMQIEEQTVLIAEYTQQHELVCVKHDDNAEQYELIKDELTTIDNQLNELRVSKQLLEQQINLTTKQINDKQLQLSQATQQLTIITQEQEQLDIMTLEHDLSKTQDEMKSLTAKINEQNDLIAAISININNLQKQLDKFERDKTKTQEALNQARLQQHEYSIMIENDQENIANLSLTEYDSATIIAQNRLDPNQIQAKIVELKLQIEVMGLVNLKAIEDLGLAQAKHDDLNIQIQDLMSAITALEQAIIQIDNETRKMLNTTYLKVSEIFNVYFRVLFGGGSAKLALTEGDILVAGLQIFAEPLGKKNSSIHLLSGGEKALTAMSLVFALFNLNPAPFCILDEVDAPLDDANTERFCKLVRELAAKTQFIFISHNRLTMEIAEQLVGVTMQEKGVSTTVSVALVDNVNSAKG